VRAARAAAVRTLLMFGVRHTRNPRDPQLVELESWLGEFRRPLAFSEGGIRPASTASRDCCGFWRTAIT
jgi:hypothetical protein